MIGNAAAALQGAPVTTLDIDFMSSIHGVSSFESLRSDAVSVDFSGHVVYVASLEKIIASKKTLGRPKDVAVIGILERTLDEKNKC